LESGNLEDSGGDEQMILGCEDGRWMKVAQNREISGSHGGEYEDGCLLAQNRLQ
jgi:hypothetical protein